MRSPVRFDSADLRAADELIDRFGLLAARLLPDAPRDARTIGRVLALARGTNMLVADGSAASGLHVDALANEANYASDKHVREGLTDPWPRKWAALAVRLMTAQETPVLAEEISSCAVRVRRESTRVGYDNRSGVAKVKPLLRLHLAGADRHLLDWQTPLATRTPHDRTFGRADVNAISDHERQLGERLPTSLADHFRLAFNERAQCREHVRVAVSDHPELLLEAGLDPASAVARSFADLTILSPLPHGSPLAPAELYSTLVMPGDDDELVSLALAAGLSGIAACDPNPAARSPRRPLQLDVHTASIWGLTASSWSIAFWAVGDDRILRIDNTGSGAHASLWRVFGIAADDPRAVALTQRAAESWAQDCVTRADAASPPGKVYPKHAGFRRAVLALVTVADAAHVGAERARRRL